MRYLQNENDTLTFKAGDTSETIRLSARNDNEPITFVDGDTATVHVDKDNAHVKTIEAVLVFGSNNITFSTSELSDLPAGQYQLEVWVKLASDGSQAIYPSEGMLNFTIDRNADSLEGGSITTITLDSFKDQLNKAIEEAKKQATPGKSAYQLWLDEGNKGSEQDFLASLKGAKGDQGATGETGQAGQPGLSAYQLAVQAGFKGSEKEWLDYLRKGPQGPQGQPGKDGKDGQSAYQIWLNNGHKGTETDFLNSLIGPRGEQGPKGEPGQNGQDGAQGPAGAPGRDGQNGKDGATPSLKFGTITSVGPDQPAKAELIDNGNDSYTLNLTIPRGAKGETGGVNQVIKPELTIGTVTTVNSNEQASASLTKTSESSYAINLNIPAGKAGEQGPQGEPGKAGADGKNGADGQPGKDGKDGKSAYDLAVQEGFKGDLKAWLASLKGQPGKDATGKPGADGKSAYQIWLDRGNKGDEQEFLNSLKGATGAPGKDGIGAPGRDGKRGTAIFTTSAYINPDVNPMSASIVSLKSSDSTLKPMSGDYVIANVNGETQILEIAAVNNDTVEFSSDMVNIQGAQGAQGHSIWVVNDSITPSRNVTVSALIGYTNYGTQPETNDVLISKDGDVSTIVSFSYGNSDPMTGQPNITAVTPGQILGSFGSQSNESTNANFDYDKLPKLTIVDQNKLGDYLGLDSSKSYTLDVDDFTLNDGTKDTKKFLKPGIYMLRDIANHGYNLTITSGSNMGGTYATPVQLIVTPYTILATAVEASAAVWFIRTDWSHDSMNYWGINNGWTKLAESPKSVQ